MSVLSAPLERVARNAADYPSGLLREGGKALCLFAARFYGVNDAIHMARKSMVLTLVDTSDRVLEMAEMYECAKVQTDAWRFAEWSRGQRESWDAVSVDCYTGDANKRALGDLELWCALARDVVTVTHVNGQKYRVPDGWTDSLFPRKPRSGISWLVLER